LAWDPGLGWGRRAEGQEVLSRLTGFGALSNARLIFSVFICPYAPRMSCSLALARSHPRLLACCSLWPEGWIGDRDSAIARLPRYGKQGHKVMMMTLAQVPCSVRALAQALAEHKHVSAAVEVMLRDPLSVTGPYMLRHASGHDTETHYLMFRHDHAQSSK